MEIVLRKCEEFGPNGKRSLGLATTVSHFLRHNVISGMSKMALDFLFSWECDCKEVADGFSVPQLEVYL